MSDSAHCFHPHRWPALKISGAVFVFSIVFALIAGCGQSANTSAPPPMTARSDVIITIGDRQGCVVALYNEAQGSAISCDEVVPFVKDELRLASGSSYDIRKGAKFDEAEAAKVGASLKGAGYRFIGEAGTQR